jgi:hypothetical protein
MWEITAKVRSIPSSTGYRMTDEVPPIRIMCKTAVTEPCPFNRRRNEKNKVKLIIQPQERGKFEAAASRIEEVR